MEDVWQVQEAKSRFSELIDRAIEQGPQVVTRHGKAVVRIVAVEAETPLKAVDVNDGFAAFLAQLNRVFVYIQLNMLIHHLLAHFLRMLADKI